MASRSAFAFELLHVDSGSNARLSRFTTPHGVISMPAFMPVGTQGTVKGLSTDQLRATGAEMVLANTYHLTLRPGAEVIRELGGIHEFTGWSGPILTDSGGFQIYSLARLTRVSDEGVSFRSHIDGSVIEFTPERVIQIQETLGCDVAMVLDHVPALPGTPQTVRDATRRTVLWAQRSRAAATRDDQALFGIVQGGLSKEMRVGSARQLRELDFDGYAIGGLSVGETPDEMYRTLELTCPELPSDRPRYLMGVGRPQDLLEAIRRGVDLFDCVMPTRNGRNALAYTDHGPLRLRNQQHQNSREPLEPDCPCAACRHSRGYLRHLFQAGEMLGPVLLSLHNLTYYQRLLADARDAIGQDRFMSFYQERVGCWGNGG